MRKLGFVPSAINFNVLRKKFAQRIVLFLLALILGFGLVEPGVSHALTLSNAEKKFDINYDLEPLKSDEQPKHTAQVSDVIEPQRSDGKRAPIKEDETKRSGHSKTFINNDGTKTLKYSALPQHYRKDGKWQDLTTTVKENLNYKSRTALADVMTLTDTAQLYDTTSGDLNTRLKPFQEGIDITYKDKSFSLYPQQARNVKPTKKVENTHDTIFYTNAWQHVDVTYNPMPGFLKETIILKNKNAQNKFVYEVSAGTELYAHPTKDGALAIKGIDPKEFFISPLSVNVNQRGIVSEQRATWSIAGNKVTLSLDDAWYDSLGAKDFPIAIDPSFYSDAGGEDGNFISYKSDGYVCQSYYCDPNVGSLLEGGVRKSWRVMFRMPFDQLGGGKKVLGSYLHLVKAQRTYWTGYTGWYGVGVSWAPCFGFNCMHNDSYQWSAGANTNDWTDIRKPVAWMSGENNPSPQWGGWMIMQGDEGANASYKQLDPWAFGMSVDYDTPTPITYPLTPADKQVSVSMQPTLKVNSVSDADGDAVKYYFRVSTNPSAEGGAVINSDWISTPQWTVPDGILQDGVTYYWHTYTLGATQTNPDWVRSFKIDQRNGKDNTQTYDTVGPVGINLATGNATIDNSSHTMSALGGSLGVNLNYNTPNRAKKGLKAEYWNTANNYSFAAGAPTSTPNVVRTDQDINFDWASGSPDARISTDNWYARWTGKMTVPKTGAYSFGASIDDDYAVYINGSKVASSGCCSSPTSYANAVPVSLSAGQVIDIRVEYREYVGAAVMKLFVKGPVTEQVLPQDWLYTDDTNGSKLYGLMGRYYTDNANAHDLDAAANDPMRLMLARQDTKMNLNFGSSGPATAMQADNFMARWTGYLTVPTTGDYQLGASTDDGLRIKLNNGLLGTQNTLINAWQDQAATLWSGNTNIKGGVPVPITIDWFEHGGGASINLLVRGNGIAEQEIPVSWLTPKAGALPEGWQLNLDVDGDVAYERLRVSGTSVILEDSSRQTHEYTWTGSGYKPPVNEDGTLTKNSDNTYTLVDVDGRAYIFDAEGKLTSLTTPADDRQPAALRYEYAGDPSRLIKITDGVTPARYGTLYYKNINDDNTCGQPAGFDSAPSGMLCAFKTSDGDVTKFYYQAGQLARIEKPGNDLADYRYNAKGQIDTIRDSIAADVIAAGLRANDESVTTKLVYDGLGRITSVTAPAATQGAVRLEHKFEYKAGDTTTPLYRLYQPSNPTTHISTNVQARAGTTESWQVMYIPTTPEPGTRAVNLCRRPNNQYFMATEPTCYGNTVESRIGYMFAQPTGQATIPYSRIRAADGYVLEYPATSLAGWTTEEVLGYGYPVQPDAGVTDMHVVGATEPSGFSKRVVYDSLLRTTKSSDLTGQANISEWDNVKDLKLSSTDATGLKSTTIYDADDRPVDSYGPAPATWFGGDRKPLAANVNQVSRISTGYDEGMYGLAVSAYPNKKLLGVPKYVTTGFGNLPYASYGLGLTNGMVTPTDGLSIRATGRIKLDQIGTYTLRMWHADGARFYIDDQLIASDWSDGQERFTPEGTFNNQVAGKTYRITIEAYRSTTTSDPYQRVFAMLAKKAPGAAAFDDNVGSMLSPAYNLTTSNKAYDAALGDVESRTTYKDPAYSLIDKTTLDPTGLNYESKATYETPGTGFLRQTSKTLPGGTTTTYQHYGASDTRDNPCTPEIEAFHQAGLAKGKTEPDPDSAGPQAPRTSEAIFNESGHIVASRYNNDPWTCTSYDARGRVLQTIVPAIDGRPGRVITNDHAKDGNPLITTTTDASGTIRVENDLLGRTVKYTDSRGKLTTNIYDNFGKLTSRTSPLGTENYVYDDYDRIIVQKLDGVAFATITYDQFGRIANVQYPAGISLNTITRDQLGRLDKVSYLASSRQLSDEVVRSTSGKVISGIENGVSKSYTYDKANRLTNATIGSNSFSYEFGTQDPACTGVAGSNTNANRNSNRTKLTINGQMTSYCYDFADRLASSSDAKFTNATYDSHGNTTGLGDATLKTDFAYDADDRNTSIKESTNGTATKEVAYGRDVQNRIISREYKVAGQIQSNNTYGYTGAGDSPDFLLDGNGAVVQKYLSLPGGVSVTIKPQSTSAGAITYSVSNIHGDTMATINADGAVTGLHMTGPFGEALPNQPLPINTAFGASWGYVGYARKTYDIGFAVSPTQMGARVYIAQLGRFLSVDPVEGGTLNNYVYAQDPVNQSDLDGNGIFGAILRYVAVKVTKTAAKVAPYYVRYLSGSGKPIKSAASSYSWSKPPELTSKISSAKGKQGSQPIKLNKTAITPKDLAGKAIIGGATANVSGTLTVRGNNWTFKGTMTINPDSYDFKPRPGRDPAAEASTRLGLGIGQISNRIIGVQPRDYEHIIEGEIQIEESGSY